MVNILKKLYGRISDFFEVYIPCVTFAAVFVTYIVMIVYRYLFDAQINWVYELSMIAFVWTVVLSASCSSRREDHIMFTMLYDKLPAPGQAVCRILGNLIIVAFMLVLLPRAVDAVRFLAIKKSSLLKIPFHIVFAPFVVFNVLTVLHHGVNIAKDVAALWRGKEAPQ